MPDSSLHLEPCLSPSVGPCGCCVTVFLSTSFLELALCCHPPAVCQALTGTKQQTVLSMFESQREGHMSAYGIYSTGWTPAPLDCTFFFLLYVRQSVQLLSRVQLFATPWTVAHWASLSITNSQSLLRLMSIELVMPSSDPILCCSLLLPPSLFPSTGVFSNESALHIRWSDYWSFNFSISPSNEYSGLVSFRMDWLDLLAVQGTLKSFLQHRSSKACLWRSAFFIIQLSHPYMTTGKTSFD